MKLSFITRYSIMFFSVIIILTSCRKELAPVPNSSNTSTTKNDDKPILLTEDEVMHSVSLNIGTQYVKTAVNSNVLTLTYEEDASTVLLYKGYDLSFSIRFNEDFSVSALNKLDFTTPGPNGTFTTNWKGNDLKVLNEVVKTDLLINNQPSIKLRLARRITFTKSFASNADAQNAQIALLNTKTDVIKFNSYVVFGRDYPVTTIAEPIIYSK